MPQSLANVLLHVVFSTKNRAPFLQSRDLREGLKKYMVGTLRNIDCPSLIVNCVDDHLHCLCRLSRTITIAKLIEEMKTSTSAWIKTTDPHLQGFYWQSGYGAFSVSPSNIDQVMAYIKQQEEHHRTVTFQDELRELLRRHRLVYGDK